MRFFSPKAYEAASDSWVRDVQPPKSSTPSFQEAHKAFSNIVSVAQDKQTGYVSLSTEHPSPIIAAEWVNWLVEDVNAPVKAQEVSEAEKSIEYLEQQAANTSLANLQAMFFELIQSQTETVMLADMRPEYVFKTIDPAVAPEEKSKPNRALICVLETLLGGLLGVFITLIRHYTRAESDS